MWEADKEVLKAYKELSNLFFNYLNDKSFFTSKVIYDDEYIYIDSFKVSNNDYNIHKMIIMIKISIYFIK